MSFGRNPHAAKASLAEQKAIDAEDAIARARAYREAAHLWDRAADREKPGKMRDQYERNANKNRALADGDASPEDTDDVIAPAAPKPPAIDPRDLN
jgi:hypothetical protein